MLMIMSPPIRSLIRLQLAGLQYESSCLQHTCSKQNTVTTHNAKLSQLHAMGELLDYLTANEAQFRRFVT